MPVVYILRRSDGTFDAGHTDKLAMRLEAHNAGTGSDYTAARRPVELVYHEQRESLKSAVTRERQLKRWSAAKKKALASGDLAQLRQVGRRRHNPP